MKCVYVKEGMPGWQIVQGVQVVQNIFPSEDSLNL